MKKYKKNKNIKIAITGHSGVLGSEFVKRYPNYDYFFFKGDLLKKKDVYKWLKKVFPDIILHLAAKVPIDFVNKNLTISKKVSVQGTRNILNCLKKNKFKKIYFFFSSTSHIYKKTNKKISENSKKEPSTNYGKFKLLAEKEIISFSKKNRNFKYCIARVFSFTNYNQKDSFLIPALYKKILKNNKTVFKNLNSFRDFVHIEDVCDAINLLISKKIQGIFNVGSGKKTKVLELAKLISKIKNKKIKYEIDNNQKKDCLMANISKIKQLGWKPRKNNYKIIKDFIMNKDKFK